MKLQGQPFNLTGRFDLGATQPKFSLNIHAKNIIYADARALLPVKIAKSLSLVDILNPLDASAAISGSLRGGDPLVYITWESKEAHVATPFLDFDEAKFTGYFTNEAVKGLPLKDPNSKIVINNFKALWHNLPVRANLIEINDLSTPILTCDLKSDFPLVKMNELLGESSLQMTGGNASIDMTYKGPVEKNDNTNSFLNGTINFQNGTVLYVPRNVEMQQVNATMVFKNSDVLINNFQTVILNNKFIMQGAAKNLLTLINAGPNNINIDWNIYTPGLNLNPFTFLLAPRKKVTAAKSNKAVISNIASKIDDILDQGKLAVQLKADKLVFRKFEAENLVANISLLADSYQINTVSMNHAGESSASQDRLRRSKIKISRG